MIEKITTLKNSLAAQTAKYLRAQIIQRFLCTTVTWSSPPKCYVCKQI